MRAPAQARQKMRGNNELQEIDKDKTKDQLQLNVLESACVRDRGQRGGMLTGRR